MAIRERIFNAGEQSQISSLHFLGLTQFLDALTYPDSFALPVSPINSNRRNGIENEFTEDAIHHLLLVIREVPVEDEFNQVKDVCLVLVTIVLGNG